MRSSHVLLFAAIAVLALQKYVPHGNQVLYPFTLLVTWIHEMGHGLAALAVGGSFSKLEIFRDASGMAYTSALPGWRQAAVDVGGLLAPPVVGSFLLGFVRGPRRARLALGMIAVALLVSLLVWVRSTVGLLVVPGLAVLIGLAAIYAGGAGGIWLAQFIGVISALDTVTRMIPYVFSSSAVVGGADHKSDIAAAAENLGGPMAMWGVLVTAFALGLLALGFRLALRGSVEPDKGPLKVR